MIIGLTDTTKIINSASVSRDSNGLQVLSETITVTEGGLASFTPKYLDPRPDFPTMAAETINTSRGSGGLCTISVNYVGLLAEGAEKFVGLPSAEIPNQPSLQSIEFPKPNIQIFNPLGQKGVAWLHFPGILSVQFLDIATPKATKLLLDIFQPYIRQMPAFFRGVNLPNPGVLPYLKGNTLYSGFYVSSFSTQKRGFFNIVSVTAQDSISNVSYNVS